MGKNSPTARELIMVEDRKFLDEKQHLAELINSFHDGGPAGCTTSPHPFFGPLTPEEWERECISTSIIISDNSVSEMDSQKHLFQLPADSVYLNAAYMSPLLKSVEEAGIVSMQQNAIPNHRPG